MFPPLFLGGMAGEPAEPAAPPAPQAPMAPPPAPIQRVASQGPNQPPAWLQALPALFAIGARLGGSPTTGTGALLGAQQADVMAERQRAQRAAEGQRQQQLDMQQAEMMARQQAYQEQIEQRKQAAIGRAVDDLRVQPFKTRAEYEQAVTAYENLINQQYPIRPNTLRTLVPFKAPDVQGRAYKAVETLAKQDNWQDVVTSNGLIKFDRDGDGVPESVKVSELIELGNFPMATDPQTGQPMLAPKEVKAENIQDFDITYKGVLAEWQAEGKSVADPAVQGKAALEAKRRVAQAGKIATPPDPTLQAIRELTLQQARQNAKTRMYSPGQERAINQLADDYARDSKDFAQRAQSYDTVIGAAKDPSAAGDLSLIFAYMKMLDPGSVVREGEFATAQNATGVPDRIRNLYNQVMQGVRLNPAQRNDFLKQAGNIYATAKTRQDRITASYSKRAQQRGLDPNDVIVDYGAAQNPPGATTPKKKQQVGRFVVEID